MAPLDPQRAGPRHRCPVRQGNVAYRTAWESRAVAAAVSCLPISDQIHGCCGSRGASKQPSFRTSSSVPGHRSSTLATDPQENGSAEARRKSSASRIRDCREPLSNLRFRALRVCPASGSLCPPRGPAHPIEKETTITKHHPDPVPESLRTTRTPSKRPEHCRGDRP